MHAQRYEVRRVNLVTPGLTFAHYQIYAVSTHTLYPTGSFQSLPLMLFLLPCFLYYGEKRPLP